MKLGIVYGFVPWIGAIELHAGVLCFKILRGSFLCYEAVN